MVWESSITMDELIPATDDDKKVVTKKKNPDDTDDAAESTARDNDEDDVEEDREAGQTEKTKTLTVDGDEQSSRLAYKR